MAVLNLRVSLEILKDRILSDNTLALIGAWFDVFSLLGCSWASKAKRDDISVSCSQFVRLMQSQLTLLKDMDIAKQV